jgi:predicted Zn-dependent protease
MARIFLLLLIIVFAAPGWAAGTSGEEGAQLAADDPVYGQAVVAIKAERFKRAAALLRDVVGRNPDNIDALSNLGYANSRLGRYDQARQRYARALALEPGHLGANEYLGELYLRMGNLTGATGQLAALGNICGITCAEYRDLAAAIAGYKQTGRFQDHNKGKNEK